jgi:hypothetical protein
LPTPPVLIPAIPTPVPSTDDPGNFDDRADATLGALPDAVDGMNAANENVYANALEVFDKASEITAAAMVATDAAGAVGRSNASQVVGPGVKTVPLLAAKPNLVVLNKRVVMVQMSDPSIKMFGTISSVANSSQFGLTVLSGGVFGSGSYSGWMVIDAAFFASAATEIEIRAGVTDAAAMAPKPFWGAQQAVAVPYASSMQLDLATGMNFTTTITGAPTIGQPLNMKVGQEITWTWEAGAGAGQPSFNSTYWKRGQRHAGLLHDPGAEERHRREGHARLASVHPLGPQAEPGLMIGVGMLIGGGQDALLVVSTGFVGTGAAQNVAVAGAAAGDLVVVYVQPGFTTPAFAAAGGAAWTVLQPFGSGVDDPYGYQSRIAFKVLNSADIANGFVRVTLEGGQPGWVGVYRGPVSAAVVQSAVCNPVNATNLTLGAVTIGANVAGLVLVTADRDGASATISPPGKRWRRPGAAAEQLRRERVLSPQRLGLPRPQRLPRTGHDLHRVHRRPVSVGPHPGASQMNYAWKGADGAWVEIDRELTLAVDVDGDEGPWLITPGHVEDLPAEIRAQRGYLPVLEADRPAGVCVLGKGLEDVDGAPRRVWETRAFTDEEVAAMRAAQVQSVKAEAGRRILALYPTWKQANMNMRATELVDLRIDRELTAEEAAERDELIAAAEWIKAVRAASDAIEAALPTDAEGLCAFSAAAADGWPA